MSRRLQEETEVSAECLPGDEACLAAKEERENTEALEAKEAEKNKNAHKSSTGLVCTNDGFVKMIQEGTEVLVGPLAFVKEMALGFVPENFKKAINYGWIGLVGLGNWVGYILASIYYLSDEVGIGADICEAFGYGYWVIDQLYILVDFMPKTDGGDEGDSGSSSMLDLGKLASAAALEGAAADALAGFNLSKATADEAAKEELQAKIDAGEDPNAEPAAEEASA